MAIAILAMSAAQSEFSRTSFTEEYFRFEKSQKEIPPNDLDKRLPNLNMRLSIQKTYVRTSSRYLWPLQCWHAPRRVPAVWS